MSQENVEFVAGIFAAVDSMDKDALVAALPDLVPQICDPEIEWIEDPQRADARVYRGHEGVIASWRQWLDSFREYDWEVDRITDCGGDDVFVAASEHATGALSGAPSEQRLYERRPSRTASCVATASFRLSTRPSKPPGYRSRRCRRRTSTSSAAASRRVTAETSKP